MTERDKKRPATREVPSGETLENCARTNPDELAETLIADVLQSRERVKKRIDRARKEIEDGALPRKGRFRL